MPSPLTTFQQTGPALVQTALTRGWISLPAPAPSPEVEKRPSNKIRKPVTPEKRREYYANRMVVAQKNAFARARKIRLTDTALLAIATEEAARAGVPLEHVMSTVKFPAVMAARDRVFSRARLELNYSSLGLGELWGFHCSTVILAWHRCGLTPGR